AAQAGRPCRVRRRAPRTGSAPRGGSRPWIRRRVGTCVWHLLPFHTERGHVGCPVAGVHGAGGRERDHPGRRGVAWHRPAGPGAGRWVLPAAVAAGVLDASANVCYVLAARAGLFGMAVVITSLYPGITVLLARVVLGERTRAVQRFGLALAAAGVAMVTF